MPRVPVWFLITACASLGGLAAAACTTTVSKSPPLPLSDDEGGTRRRDSGTTGPSSSGGSSGEEPPLEGGTAPGRVYAHTPDTLYLFEPVTKKLTMVGKFDCVVGTSVIDVALDRSGAMYATTFSKFLSVDPTNAKCTVIQSPGTYPNSLSFVPVGTVDATKEALVGYASVGSVVEEYVRIDTVTGAMTHLGYLNPTPLLGGVEYEVAGDMVALIRDANRAYVIVVPATPPDGGITTNFLAEVDPKTGELKDIIGPTNQVGTFGFGYWGGKGYGFSDDGRITEIDMATGKSTNVLTLDGGTSGWYGAGVTTDSPIQ